MNWQILKNFYGKKKFPWSTLFPFHIKGLKTENMISFFVNMQNKITFSSKLKVISHKNRFKCVFAKIFFYTGCHKKVPLRIFRKGWVIFPKPFFITTIYIHVISKRNWNSKSYSKKVTGSAIFAKLLFQKSTWSYFFFIYVWYS